MRPPAHRRSLAATFCVLQMWAATPAMAELTVVENADGQQGLTAFKMTVTPAAEPTPAFKYRLTPRPLEMRPGNAAIHYMRAFAESGLSSAWKRVRDQYGNDVDGSGEGRPWLSTVLPLKDLPLDKARQAAAQFDAIVAQSVERAVVRDDCDWGRNLEELRGLDVIGLLLPEAQESRSLARALMLRARVALADGDFEKAITQLRMTYRLGQHVATDPILVCGLVGIAEAGLANGELIELIATSGSPNMYWALAELDRPLVDLRPAVRYELQWAMRIFPILMDPEKEEHTPQEWARRLTQAVQDMDASGAVDSPVGFNEQVAQMGVAAYALVAYPDAKQRLVEGGMDANDVERMAVGQALAVDASREYRQLADNFGKGWFIPAARATEHFRDADALFGGNKFAGGFGHMMGSLLLPALGNVRSAQLRLERQLDALQAVEALRMHAAAAGKLPASLDEIAVVPVPVNPVTGQPFNYRLEGEMAVLELPQDEGARDGWRFEITLAK